MQNINKKGKNTYGLIFHPGYTHERKAFVGQEIITLWQDIKNSLETFTLEIFQIFSYFCVIFCFIKHVHLLVSKVGKYIQTQNMFLGNTFLILNLFTAYRIYSELS